MAMPQVDWESIKSFVQIPLSWFKEVSRRSNIFSKHPLIIVERNNPDGIALNIDPSQLPKGEQLQVFNSNFQYKDGSILSGVVCIARQYYLVDGLSPAEGESRISDGEYRLKFTLNNSTKQWVIVVESGSGFAAPNDTTSYAPLFSIYNGEVAADYRNTVYLYARE